ncbi:MAG: DEAD/DEAH box helicase family protein [Halanaerobiales bacterium]|nr:DEAD/DEAH box helicase family protein [Halanaerobiales bacterium]
MELPYNPNYFLTAEPLIYDNEELREPQIDAYASVYDHFVVKQNTQDAVVILPTGVGKTGLMGLLPFHICKGRTLIITPQIVIKDAVLDSLDPDHPGNFWLMRNVFDKYDDLPCLIEFGGRSTRQEWLEAASVVIVNIQKLQKRLQSSLIKRVPPDFFDMIIIDEAHHSVADTWVDTVQYFSSAKVVKLTGTPTRSDNVAIWGKPVFTFKLSQAMAANYVKSLNNFTYVPDELYFTIDENDAIKYTKDEILSMNLKPKEWISRSVAYSLECSEKIVDISINKLEEKLSDGNEVHHKIIAVACSIYHAKQIKDLYESKGYPTAIVHSELKKADKKNTLKDIENHRVKVVVHVAMLGEGYDHPYLSVAAIFRPFRNALPYAQFIGRILRIIPFDEGKRPEDNIGEIVSHKDLFLDEFWEYYKNQMEEAIIIKDFMDKDEGTSGSGIHVGDKTKKTKSKGKINDYDKSIGQVNEIGNGTIIGDTFLTTNLIRQRDENYAKDLEMINHLKSLYNIDEDEAKKFLKQIKSSPSSIKRPDAFFTRKYKGIDRIIRSELVPELLVRYDIKNESNNLKKCKLFRGRYSWITQDDKNNAAMLAIYFNENLRYKINKPRSDWSDIDYDNAYQYIPEVKKYVEKVLESYLNIS